jgi:hypothetical protein
MHQSFCDFTPVVMQKYISYFLYIPTDGVKIQVVVKLARVGSGPPGREPRLSEEERKQLMLVEHRKRRHLGNPPFFVGSDMCKAME